MAEHRLERVVQYADSVVHLPGDGTRRARRARRRCSRARASRRRSSSSAALAGWTPLPLSVRDAAPPAPTPLVDRLADVDAAARGHRAPTRRRPIAARAPAGSSCATARSSPSATSTSSSAPARSSRSWAATARASRRCCGRCRARARARADASTSTAATPPTLAPAAARARSSGSCRTRPSDLLYLDTVAEELAAGRRRVARRASGARRAHARSARARHRRRHASARPLRGPAARARARGPARGDAARRAARRADPRPRLPRQARARAASSRELAAAGTRSSVSTHDVEFVATAAHRVVVMAEGEIVADGPTADVIVASPAFAPQVAKILAPRPWLTVEQLRVAGVFDRRRATR